ncbi:MAG: hypothetical protein HY898_16220 [Deltaproteobacteria bacterium]|nr:hypothetical protein [Deltaproteobacteria bacterium]
MRSILLFGIASLAVFAAGACGGVAESGNDPSPGTGGSAGSSVGGSSGKGGSAPGGSAGTGGITPAGGSAGAGAAGSGGAPLDASVDVADVGPPDAPGDVDQITAFVLTMNGVWLVGWGGGMNHYSWVRIRSDSPGSWSGTAEFLAGDDLAVNSPYWPCSGAGKFFIPAKPYSILFEFPSSCPSGIELEYTFDPFYPPSAYPKGAILAATVTPLSMSGSIEGYKFPDTQCNGDMTACTDPLK